MTKTELLQLLNDTKSETLQYFDLPDGDLGKSYGEGKWNIRQILHHLNDTEILFHGRLKKIIAEPKQVIWAINPDDWNHAFGYDKAPLTGRKDLYALFRDMNHQLIEQFYDAYHNKEFVHNQTGLRTLQMEFEKVALHNATHLEHIQKALTRA